MALSKKRLAMGEEAWAEYQKERIRRKTKSPQSRKKNALAVADWRRNTKERLIEYKGGKCEICGYSKKCPGAYDFHHINPGEKEFGISRSGKCRKYEDLIAEVDKCQLLCKNCHAEVEQIKYIESRNQSGEE